MFRSLVLARIVEPTKLDSLRVVEEAGFAPPAYATLKRRLPAFAKESWRQKLAAARARTADLGPASLVLYDVSTLYFETDAGDGFREPGFSEERRLEPQITIGLLTDASGFPLMGLSFILGARIPDVPYVVQAWRHEHPDEQIPDGHIFTQPWPAGPKDQRRDQIIYYQYRADRARRTLHGIDEQVAKAEQAVAGKTAVKRNRFIQLTGATKSVNRTLEADLRARPIHHHKRESIDAHLTVVFAALAVSRWIEQTAGWSIKKFVRTTRRYRTINIQAGEHTLTAVDPLPDDLRDALTRIHDRGAH